jgi:hypothetical protein
MIELITTVVIIASSALLFGYWFRYTCLLMLNTRTARDYASDIAMANQLSFANVQTQLSQASADLGGLRASLDRDFAVVSKMLDQASAGQAGIEQKMLAIHYRLMGVWYAVGSHVSPTAARQALEEMSMVVAHFANSIGEAAASPSAA